MHSSHDLGSLDWTLTGWTPHLWRMKVAVEVGKPTDDAEVPAIPAPVPGSVQQALRNADLLPDWNQAGIPRECEWVEHRHWVYSARIPDEWLDAGATFRLNCEGLDYSGWVWVNDTEVDTFMGTHIPHVFDLTASLAESGNWLRIVFDVPPRWLGQFGYTSQVTEWKTRFNYTWDWQPRLVQLGIWNDISLDVVQGAELVSLDVSTDADLIAGTGILELSGQAEGGDDARIDILLSGPSGVIRTQSLTVKELAKGVEWTGLETELWWPNGQGEQPLYDLAASVQDAAGVEQHRRDLRVGFRNIVWETCEGAPADADPWLCVINGRRVFLQGINFPPMQANYADVTDQQYRDRVASYQDLGLNTFRINGCGFLEKEILYNLCDEAGILLWQDAPLSSSGLDNIPPTDQASIDTLAAIFTSYIKRRKHHAALLLWNGGNEITEAFGDSWRPATTRHPLIGRLAEVARELDPTRRFIPGSPTGHRYIASEEDFGKGVNGNVHGPWKPNAGDLTDWRRFWDGLDSQFSAEMGAPGSSDIAIIEKYAGGLDPFPVSTGNPVWRRPISWWIETDAFAEVFGRQPESVAEYIEWSQQRQVDALTYAFTARKKAFPRTGGMLMWCGHDCYPVPTNTSLMDFDGNLKPAALALKKVWTAD